MEPISHSRTVIAIGILLLAGAPAAASRHDHPIILGGGGADLGWTAITLTTNGDAAFTEVLARDVGDATVATYVFEGDRLRYGLLFVSLDAPTPATITEIGLGDLVAHEERRVEDPSRSGDLGLFLTLNDPSIGNAPKVGTFRILLFAAGNAATWDWAIRGGPGTTIDAIEQGSDTFLHTARDFRGAMHVERAEGEAATRAQAANALTVPIERTFVGAAYSLNQKLACVQVACYGATSTDVLALQRPGAIEPTRCFCTLHQAPAGTYAFQLTGADVWSAERPAGARVEDDAVVIAGADAAFAS